MLVLPFKALCEEKAQALDRLLAPAGKKAKRFYGGQGSNIIFTPDTGAAMLSIQMHARMLQVECTLVVAAVFVHTCMERPPGICAYGRCL